MERNDASDSDSDATPTPTPTPTPSCHSPSTSLAHRAVHQYRSTFRSTIPPNYSPYRHFATINVSCIFGIAVSVWMGGGMVELLSHVDSVIMALLSFLFANAVEYWAHRSKLHHPLIRTRHSHVHHRFFTDKEMSLDSFADVHAILFPPAAPLFLLLIVVPVIAAMPTLLLGVRAGAACAAMLLTYYLTYEWMR